MNRSRFAWLALDVHAVELRRDGRPWAWVVAVPAHRLLDRFARAVLADWALTMMFGETRIAALGEHQAIETCSRILQRFADPDPRKVVFVHPVRKNPPRMKPRDGRVVRPLDLRADLDAPLQVRLPGTGRVLDLSANGIGTTRHGVRLDWPDPRHQRAYGVRARFNHGDADRPIINEKSYVALHPDYVEALREGQGWPHTGDRPILTLVQTRAVRPERFVRASCARIGIHFTDHGESVTEFWSGVSRLTDFLSVYPPTFEAGLSLTLET